MIRKKFRNYNEDFLEEIVKDFQIACNSKLSEKALFDMAFQVPWELTEWRGAIIGCPYWSEAAFKELNLENGRPCENGYTVYDRPLNKKLIENYKGKIVHEHIVSRRLFIDYIMNCHSDKKELPQRENFEKMIPCIIEKEKENKELNNNFKSTWPNNLPLQEIKNPWERYIKSGINTIYHVQ